MDILNKIAVTEICDILTVPAFVGKTGKINNRKCYGLSFCTEGQITYTHKGVNYVSNKNTAIILPQGESYLTHGDKPGLFPVINFKNATPLCDKHVCIPVENPSLLFKDFEQMKALFLFEKNRAKLFSIFYDIIHKLNSDSGSPSQIKPALKYIEDNFSNPILTNELLAGKCNISEVYFRKLFIKEFNTTPRQYIINIRINKAKQLLCDGALKINAISEKCGFSNPYHFCRCFKEHTGVTPSEYMLKNKISKI